MSLNRLARHVSILAVAAICVSAAHAKSANLKAVLNVNDANAVGTAGDSLLSLDEAVRLANGTLALDALSATERAQVKGVPGANSRDRIQLAAGATITVAKGAAVSALIGNDGDTLDGTGATLVAADSGKGNGLVISSSDFTLTGFQARGFDAPLQVDFGGRKLRNITLTKLRLSMIESKGTLLTAAAHSSDGSLSGLTVTDSVFETGGKKEGNLVYLGSAVGMPGGRAITNTLLENVLFSRNQLKGGAIGMYIHGTLSGANTTNATTRKVTVSDNVFTGQADSPLNIAGALPAVGANHSNITLEDIVVTRNRLEAANWGIWMGHETFGFGVAPTTARESKWRNVTISNNIVTLGSHGGKAHCITLETGADSPGDTASDNLIENVKITGNDVRGCKNATDGLGTGIIVYAGRNLFFGDRDISVNTGNSVRNLIISNNRVADSDRGIVVGAAYSLPISNKIPESGRAALQRLKGVVSGATMSGVVITGNKLTNDRTGIRVIGGEGPAGSHVTGNSTIVTQIKGNRITGAEIQCEAIANAGAATGNMLQATCPKPGR